MENPQCRVVPTLAVLKESAKQQHDWGLLPGNARILSQVPSRVKGMLGAVALRRLGEEAMGMVPKAEGSALLAMMRWHRRLSPVMEEAMVGSANWFGDLTA